jgi:DMSO/TMAO reductase YedYZ molybdopterin-dependent catalytic subunit
LYVGSGGITITSTDPDLSEEVRKYLSRRRFLALSGGASATALAGCLGPEEEEPTDNETDGEMDGEMSLGERYPGLRILSEEPENAEAAERSTYDDQFVTPVEELYIRNHYATPDIDADQWTVSLTGLDEDVELTVDEIRNDYSTETVTHTMQCSGNGRSYFEPTVGGNQWTFGAVGNNEWTGTPVSEILEDHGVSGEDGYLTVMGGEAPEGEDIFTRSIPMEKVMDDCLLAYEMDGEDVPPDHGYPIRFLVPGWFGNNNVKWVDRLHVMDTMVVGDEWEDGDQRLYTHWQQYSYRIIPEEDDGAEHYEDIPTYDTWEQMERTDEIRNAYMYDQISKSIIGSPGEDARISAGTHDVTGVAWAGDDAVDTVEISPDGGETWIEATIEEDDGNPYSWVLFSLEWEAEPGEYTLVSRATDEEGRAQPAEVSSPDEQLRGIRDDKYPWNQKGYANNAYMPHAVEVEVTEN